MNAGAADPRESANAREYSWPLAMQYLHVKCGICLSSIAQNGGLADRRLLAMNVPSPNEEEAMRPQAQNDQRQQPQRVRQAPAAAQQSAPRPKEAKGKPDRTEDKK